MIRRQEGKVSKLNSIVPVVLLLLMASAAVRAQTGCVDSPEDPTVVFGLIAAAASVGIMRLRAGKSARDK
jgi:XrtJ-associated TM-motif-TM protein